MDKGYVLVLEWTTESTIHTVYKMQHTIVIHSISYTIYRELQNTVSDTQYSQNKLHYQLENPGSWLIFKKTCIGTTYVC